MDTAHHILNFWFGEPRESAGEYGKERKIWFEKSPVFDQAIRERFLAAYENALRGTYAHWMDQPRSALALVVLLDQFPRNMFRNTARSFEADPQALQVAQTAVARHHDQQVLPVERLFFYLPYEHSENLAHQDQAIALFEVLVQTAPELRSSLDYAYRHRDVIARFGRFPHRNACLGRASTPQESIFLQQHGSRF
ncbi:MAG: DUF924 family protein [Leptolyngbyaceae cyanobacterium]